jgi:alkyldihydroxyacetonephosphate synthase
MADSLGDSFGGGVVRALRTELGDDRVSTDPEVLARMGSDTWPLRLAQVVLGRPPNRPLAVVRPTSVAEVATAVRVLATHDVAVVPRGGGSGVVGGADAPSDAVVLDLGALDGILALDEDNLHVCVGAGVMLGQLEAWLQERGYTTGHYPQSIDLAQVGGLVATRSSGQFSSKYGSIEDLVLGLEVVLPDAEIVRMSPMPRRAVGPDLRALWIGSEGTLGVITEVTLKVVPLPEERCMQAFALPSFAHGLAAMRKFMRVGWRPALVRLHDAFETRRGFGGELAEGVAADEVILLLLSEGPRSYASTEMTALGEIVVAEGGRSLGAEPVEKWLARRNDVRHFEQYIHAGAIVDTIEVAASWAAIARIHTLVCEQVPQQVATLRHISGHSSHSYPQGTNLYFSFVAEPAVDARAAEDVYRGVWAAVMDITLREGGTISHHHGIGRMRTPWVGEDLGSAHRLLEVIERSLDPRGIMNPGVLVEGQRGLRGPKP